MSNAIKTVPESLTKIERAYYENRRATPRLWQPIERRAYRIAHVSHGSGMANMHAVADRLASMADDMLACRAAGWVAQLATPAFAVAKAVILDHGTCLYAGRLAGR